MSEQFTKGEWSVQQIGELPFGVCFLSKGVAVYSSVKAVNDAKHDAALIACAPEMYEMLKIILSVYEMDYDDTDKALKLLAKARGEA